MNLKKLAVILLFASLLAGCAAPSPTPEATATTAPTPADPRELAIQAAVSAMAYNLSLPEDSIEVSDVQAVDWPDSCLGAGTGSMACQQVITPGYKILLKTGEKTYEYHTNLDGSSVMLSSSY